MLIGRRRRGISKPWHGDVRWPLTCELASTARLKRGLVLLVPAIVLLAASGCGHRRQSLRPVYITPAPAATAPVHHDPFLPDHVRPGRRRASVDRRRVGGEPAPTPSTLGPAQPAGEVAHVGLAALDSTVTAPPARACPTSRTSSQSRRTTEGHAPSERPAAEGPEHVAQTTAGAAPTGGCARSLAPRAVSALSPMIPTTCSSPPRPTGPGSTSSCTTAPAPTGGYDQIDREHRKRARVGRAAATTSSSATAPAAPTARSRSPSAGRTRSTASTAATARTPTSTNTGSASAWSATSTRRRPRRRQIAAAQALVAYLSDRYQIPARPHRDPRPPGRLAHRLPRQDFPDQAILGSGNHLVQR